MAGNYLAAFVILALATALSAIAPTHPLAWPRWLACGLAVLAVLVLLLR